MLRFNILSDMPLKVLIPSEKLLVALEGMMRKSLNDPDPMMGLIRSALKVAAPLILRMYEAKAKAQGVQVELPDLKSPEARSDMLGYTVRFFLRVMCAEVEKTEWTLQGSMEHGQFEVVGFTPTASTVVDTISEPVESGSGTCAGDCEECRSVATAIVTTILTTEH